MTRLKSAADPGSDSFRCLSWCVESYGIAVTSPEVAGEQADSPGRSSPSTTVSPATMNCGGKKELSSSPARSMSSRPATSPSLDE